MCVCVCIHVSICVYIYLCTFSCSWADVVPCSASSINDWWCCTKGWWALAKLPVPSNNHRLCVCTSYFSRYCFIPSWLYLQPSREVSFVVPCVLHYTEVALHDSHPWVDLEVSWWYMYVFVQMCSKFYKLLVLFLKVENNTPKSILALYITREKCLCKTSFQLRMELKKRTETRQRWKNTKRLPNICKNTQQMSGSLPVFFHLCLVSVLFQRHP